MVVTVTAAASKARLRTRAFVFGVCVIAVIEVTSLFIGQQPPPFLGRAESHVPPIIGIAVCCACATTGQAAAPPISPMNWRRFN
jgi:hypothetical protein